MYHLMQTDKEVMEALAYLDKAPRLGIDTETTGLDPHTAKLVSVQLSDGQDGWYFPIAHKRVSDAAQNLSTGAIVLLKDFLTDPMFCAYNANFDSHVIERNFGIKIAIAEDPMLMMLILDRDEANLKFAARTILGARTIDFKDLFPPDEELNIANKSPQEVLKYGCDDAIWTVQLVEPLRKLCEERGLTHVYELELAYQQVLRDMEYKGLVVRPHLLEEKAEEWLVKLERAKESFWNLVDARFEVSKLLRPERFKLNSSKKLGDLLYEQLGYNCMKHSGKTGSRSASKEALEQLPQDELIMKLMEVKSMESVYTTYLTKAGAYVGDDGRVHPDHAQIGESGRPYTRNPNLQQWPIPCREAVFPDAEYYFILADYKAAELRLLSAITGCKFFKDAFANGVDPHVKVMTEMTGRPAAEIDKRQRDMGKVLNYGLIYGMDEYGLSRRLLIKPDTAKKLMEKFFSVIPEVVEWRKIVEAELDKTTYTTTLFGRKRRLPGIKSATQGDRDRARRQAVNHYCQGGIADLMKQVSRDVYKSGGAWLRDLVQKEKVRIGIEVHDSILFVVHKSIEPGEAVVMLREVMEKEINGVKMECDFVIGKVGQAWGTLK